jgi:hypothetical protein
LGVTIDDIKNDFAVIAFVVSLAVLAYGWGAVTSTFKLFPYGIVRKSFVEVENFMSNWKDDLGLEPTRYLVTAHNPTRLPEKAELDKAMPGLRVVAGYFYNRSSVNGAVLFDEQGKELHFWPIDQEAIAAGIEGAVASSRHSFLHGFDVLADGSVVVSFDDANVLARLDACGEVIWGIRGATIIHWAWPVRALSGWLGGPAPS